MSDAALYHVIRWSVAFSRQNGKVYKRVLLRESYKVQQSFSQVQVYTFRADGR